MAAPNDKLSVLRRIPKVRFHEEMHGYNKQQVDRVLENLAPLADEVDILLDRLAAAEQRAAAAEAVLMESGGKAPSVENVAAPTVSVEPKGPSDVEGVAPADFDETLAKTLLLAQRTADATVKEAGDSAIRIRTEAEAEASGLREEAKLDAARIRTDAEGQRDEAVQQANAQVVAMVDEARTTLETKVSKAETELVEAHEGTRSQLLSQIEDLSTNRDGLLLDVENIEGHLAARRETIREALNELSAVVEDPERLRTSMPPTASESLPAAVVDDGPIKVDVPALETLAVGVMTPIQETPDDAVAPEQAAPDSAQSDAALGDAASGVVWADGDSAEPGDGSETAAATLSVVDPSVGEPATVGPEPEGSEVEGSKVEANDDDSGGEPTAALPLVDVENQLRSGVDETVSSRPSWADSVPEAEAAQDPPQGSDTFLDELRRVTTQETEEDDALANFLNEGDADGKGGWFGRRR